MSRPDRNTQQSREFAELNAKIAPLDAAMKRGEDVIGNSAEICRLREEFASKWVRK